MLTRGAARGFLCLLAGLPLLAQTVEVAGVTGVGASVEREADRSDPALMLGVSVVAKDLGGLGAQANYLFSRVRGHAYNRHFLTLSWHVQGEGRGQPFFHIGGGVTRKTMKDAPLPWWRHDTTSGVAILGGGLSVYRREPWFVRIEGRGYVAAGEHFTIVPLVLIGREF